MVTDVRKVSIDEGLARSETLYPAGLHATCTTIAFDCNAGEAIAARGVFVDEVGGLEKIERWEVTQSNNVTDQSRELVQKRYNPNDIVEFAAITVVGSILCVRDSLRIDNVQRIGTGSDYSLVDSTGGPAGVIEIKGINSEYTSDVAAKARTQVKRSLQSPQRIGVVAFKTPEIRIEVV